MSTVRVSPFTQRLCRRRLGDEDDDGVGLERAHAEAWNFDRPG
jgi:hypothetical protein